MKKNIKIVINLIFIFILIFFVYNIVLKINHKKNVEEKIKKVPDFEFQNIKGGVFKAENLKPQTPTLFIYFNTECEFCNIEALLIKENISKFENFQIVFVSFEKIERIKKFAENYKLINYDNIIFLNDSKISFARIFDANSIPCLVIYNKNKKYIDKIKGQTKIEKILQKLNQGFEI